MLAAGAAPVGHEQKLNRFLRLRSNTVRPRDIFVEKWDDSESGEKVGTEVHRVQGAQVGRLLLVSSSCVRSSLHRLILPTRHDARIQE